jgi:hypothetical protein
VRKILAALVAAKPLFLAISTVSYDMRSGLRTAMRAIPYSRPIVFVYDPLHNIKDIRDSILRQFLYEPIQFRNPVFHIHFSYYILCFVTSSLPQKAM